MKLRWLALVLLVVPAYAADLTFVHVSDIHYPFAKSESAATIAGLPRGPIALTPYNVTAAAPSFAIATGDLNEFGGGSGNWEGYLAMWKAWPLPAFQQLGNHDNTWDCSRPRLRKLQGSPFYAFEREGMRCIGFDTATPQDPRPSLATEGLVWLAKELERTPVEQPVFFFCHHPLNGSEFASEYERLRLLELLQTRNVVLILDGHGHGATHRNIAGFDCVMGGCAYGPTRGYGVISVQNGVLRVCHQFVGDNPRLEPLLEKPLPAKSPFVPVGPVLPLDGTVFAGRPPAFRLAVPDMTGVQQAKWTCGDRTGDMVRETWGFRAELPGDLTPGAHWVRFDLTDVAGLATTRVRWFWVEGGALKLQWVHRLQGSCQSTPTLAGKRLFVGSNDGNLNALDVATGKGEWGSQVAGEVRAQTVVLPDGRVCSAQSGGQVCCRKANGPLVWSTNVGAPVYASPVVVQDRVIVANTKGEIVALAAANGKELWRCTAPTYTIESGFAVAGETVFTGSWDGNVYAVDVADGSVRWKAKSAGSSRKNAALYYSPADCAPVYAGGKLFVADRAMLLNVFDAVTGKLLSSEENVSAVGAGAGGTVLMRHTNGRVSKRRADGTTAWEAKVPTGFVPTPPVEADGKVWMVSSTGFLSALDAATGQVLAQVQASPDLFAFAAPAASGNTAYVADAGGNMVALELRR